MVLTKAPRQNPDYSLSSGTQRILTLEYSHPQVLRNGSDYFFIEQIPILQGKTITYKTLLLYV